MEAGVYLLWELHYEKLAASIEPALENTCLVSFQLYHSTAEVGWERRTKQTLNLKTNFFLNDDAIKILVYFVELNRVECTLLLTHLHL
jgi:hypothetical protein